MLQKSDRNNPRPALRKIFDRHRCDKGSKHAYERVYEPILEGLRDDPIRLMEIGVLRGASLECWLEYFPNGEIIGIDTFARVPAESVSVLKKPRVSYYTADSTAVTVVVPPLDVIIDDGDHTPAAQLKTFKNYYPLLKDGGYFFIEDVWPVESQQYADLIGHAGKFKHCLHKPKSSRGSYLLEVRKTPSGTGPS